MIYALCILLTIACGIFWRMGGAAGYSKLWRRIGSTCCILAVLGINGYLGLNWQTFVAMPMVGLGCSSYFVWLNPHDPREYWYNFLAAALFTQLAILVLQYDFPSLMIGIGFALIGALGKVKIDESGRSRPDIFGEIYYGIVMCLGVSINAVI